MFCGIVLFLYGCGTLSFTVRGKCRLRAFENSWAEGMVLGTFCMRSLIICGTRKIPEFSGRGDWQDM